MAPVLPQLSYRAVAWVHVLANLVLPGSGTWAARRRVAGAAPIVLAQGSFVLVMSWGVWCVAVWIRIRELPTELGPYFWPAAAGAVPFLVAWVWALVSSWQILRDARSQQ